MVTVPTYGPAGVDRVGDTCRSSRGVIVGAVTTPSTHGAWTTVGATGVDRRARRGGQRDLEGRRRRGDLGPAVGSETGPARTRRPTSPSPSPRGHGADVRAGGRQRVGDTCRRRRRDRRRGHHTVGARRLDDRRRRRRDRRARRGGQRDLERRRGRVDLGPARRERRPARRPGGQRRRHRHRRGHGADVRAGGVSV